MTVERIDTDRRQVLRRAALWLLFLAPFFYLTYGTANWLAAQRDGVPNLAFAWEQNIPFLAWSIVPYWSVNLFYVVALFVNETTDQVDRLAKRYLTAQIVAVACFIAFPLTAIFTKPETSGVPGFMFTVLGGFDKPFNQAPSLHIALLIIIWDHLRRKMPPAMLGVWHGWCLLIGISVLTTYQHHAVDIPAGALLGLFALWLFPAKGASPLAIFRLTSDPRARAIGFCYLSGALLFLLFAVLGLGRSGYAILWLWPALALAIVSVGYFGAGSAVFQKDSDGSVPQANRLLLAPYRIAARLNIVFWTRRLPSCVEIASGVFLGRFPKSHEVSRFSTVIDLAAEMPVQPGTAANRPTWRSFPCVDLLPPQMDMVRQAIDAVNTARQQGPVLICCALGFQRSATLATHWLISTGRATDMDDAVRQIGERGWPVRLHHDAEAHP